MLHLFLLLLAALHLVASRHCGWADVTAAHGGYDFSRLADCAELTIEQFGTHCVWNYVRVGSHRGGKDVGKTRGI